MKWDHHQPLVAWFSIPTGARNITHFGGTIPITRGSQPPAIPFSTPTCSWLSLNCGFPLNVDGLPCLVPPPILGASTFTNLHWLVVDLRLWKIWKSVGIIIPNIWKNKRHVPNHQPVHYWWLDFPLKTSAMGFHPRSVLPASTFAKRPGDPGCSRWPSKRRSQHCGIRTYIANLGLLYVQILCIYKMFIAYAYVYASVCIIYKYICMYMYM